MRYTLDVEKFKKNYGISDSKKGLQHKPGNRINILPYVTNKSEGTIKEEVSRFKECIGAFSRNVTKKKVCNRHNNEELLDKIISNVREIEEKDKTIFKRILGELFLDQNDNLEIFHPKVFNYIIPTSPNKDPNKKQHEKDFKKLPNTKIGKFSFDVLIGKNREIIEKINKIYDEKPNNVLIELVVASFDALEDSEDSLEMEYYNCIPYVSKIFAEDIGFMVKKHEFYIENIEKLLKIYYFFYVSQLALQLKKMFKAEDCEPTKVYFNLNWEKASSTRDSYKEGWKKVKSAVEPLFAHANCLEMINHINVEEKLTYIKVKEILENTSDEEDERFVKAIDDLINIYETNITDIEWEDFSLAHIDDDHIVYEKICELFKKINYQFNKSKGNRQKAYNQYAAWFITFCKENFLRNGRRLGHILSLDEDYVLLITKLAIKDQEKIKLKELWTEFEKRGIYFDRESKSILTQLFDKLNILEKKSDSGDAQYVKRIL